MFSKDQLIKQFLKDILASKGTEANIVFAELGGAYDDSPDISEALGEKLIQYMPSGLQLKALELHAGSVRIEDIAEILSRTPVENGWTVKPINLAALSVLMCKSALANGACAAFAMPHLLAHAADVYLGGLPFYMMGEPWVIRRLKEYTDVIKIDLGDRHTWSSDFKETLHAKYGEIFNPECRPTLYYGGASSNGGNGKFFAAPSDCTYEIVNGYRTGQGLTQFVQWGAEDSKDRFLAMFDKLSRMGVMYTHETANPAVNN